MFSNPFSFSGRIRRLEYGLTLLIYFLFAFVSITIIFQGAHQGIVTLAIAPLIWLMFAQNVKRCHDLGKSGFYQFHFLALFSMLFDEGQRYENEYGPDPKDSAS